MHTARLVVVKQTCKTLTEIALDHCMHTARLVVVKQM